MTELTNIVAEARRLDIVHPATQEPVGLVLILLPDSHPQVKGAARKTINDRINHRGKVGAEQIEAARGETDAKKQIALWQEAQKLIITNVCVIPITETGQVWARREKLKWGFDLKGSMSLGPLVTEQTHFVD